MLCDIRSEIAGEVDSFDDKILESFVLESSLLDGVLLN